MGKLIRRMISLIFYSICITGFLYQVERMSSMFFQYKTSSTVQHVMHARLSAPTISLCIRYTDIVDWDKLYQDHRIRERMHRPSHFKDLMHGQSLLTIRDILDYTPNVTDILTDVHHRSPGSYLEHHTNRPGDILNVTKYYMQENICYRMMAINHQEMLIQRISSSLFHSGLMFKLTLSLAKADVFTLTLHHDEMSTTSFYFGQTMNRLADFYSLKPVATAFYYTYAINQIRLLEAPYDTRCIKSREHKSECLHECLTKHMIAGVGRAPFQTYIGHGMDFKHVNHYDLQNHTIKSIFNQVDQFCSKKCFTIACAFDFICTSIDHVFQDLSQRFEIMIMVPKIPGIRVFTIKSLNLSSFLTYVCSCFSSWFGISVVMLDPFRLMIRRLLDKSSGHRYLSTL